MELTDLSIADLKALREYSNERVDWAAKLRIEYPNQHTFYSTWVNYYNGGLNDIEAEMADRYERLFGDFASADWAIPVEEDDEDQ